MDDNTPAMQPNLGAALSLITRALVRLAREASPQAAHCETQARAAREALLTVMHNADARLAARTLSHNAEGQRLRRDTDNAGALLAEAEHVVSGFPGTLRNQVAVCAAMTYLRRARRALGSS